MREIKFRAWDNAILAIRPQMVGPYALADTALASYANIKAPIMQYTGLKDKNGKEIFEGDIIQINKFTAQIQYIPTKGAFKMVGLFPEPTANTVSYQLDHDIARTVVIGNIYENPELLESK